MAMYQRQHPWREFADQSGEELLASTERRRKLRTHPASTFVDMSRLSSSPPRALGSRVTVRPALRMGTPVTAYSAGDTGANDRRDF
jgi:hypothetical protein